MTNRLNSACPWCNGDRTQVKFVPSDDGVRIDLLGRSFPLMHAVKLPCVICKGAGEMTPERYAELMAPWGLAAT